MKSQKSVNVWVYMTEKRQFYKYHDMGSWAVSLNGVSAKNITTNDIEKATQFKERPDFEYPYFHPAMVGGKWVELKITTTMEIL